MGFTVFCSFSSGDHYQLYSAEIPVNGKRPRLLNDLTIAEDGTIYMTDSSTKWDRRHNRHQIMEGEVSGRSALTTISPTDSMNCKIHFLLKDFS